MLSKLIFLALKAPPPTHSTPFEVLRGIWTRELDRLLADPLTPLHIKNSVAIQFGDYDIWIGNYPYDYGRPMVDGLEGLVPYPRTLDRLYWRVREVQDEANRPHECKFSYANATLTQRRTAIMRCSCGKEYEKDVS